MKLNKTTDTGRAGDVRVLSEELLTVCEEFAARTSTIDGELFIGLRSLPASYERRSFSRYSSAEKVLFLDLCVTEEEINGLTLQDQRELLGSGLLQLAGRGVRSRTAPWSAEDRRAILAAFDAVLRFLKWR